MIKTRALCSAAILGLVATLFAGCGDGDNTGTKICTPNAATCSNESNSGEICSADGTRLVEFSCGDGETCSEGACVAQCVKGEERCASNLAAQVCDEDGSQWITVACEPGTACVNGEGCQRTDEGVQICDPDAASECAGEKTVKTCESDGSSWIYETCADNEACVDGECEFNADSACTPRATQCVNGASAKCNDEGTAWVVTECGEGAPCVDGLCEGIACSPGATKCAPIGMDNFAPLGGYGGLQPAAQYEFGTIYTCNAEGTGWEKTECAAGTYCAYDNISNAELDTFLHGLEAWAATAYILNTTPFPEFPDTTDSVASCVAPECLVPDERRGTLDQVGFGFYYGDEDVASAFCGSADAPEGEGVANSYTRCEGLPPFQNLHWVNYQCEEHETCESYWEEYYNVFAGGGEFRSARCSSECDPGTVMCNDSDSTITCQDDGTWGAPEQCAVDADYSYEYVCVSSASFQNTISGGCVDPVCSFWMDFYGGTTLPATAGACTPSGEFRACNPDGTLGEAVACDSYCQVSDLSGDFGSSYNTANQHPGSCATAECEDGAERCLYNEGDQSPLYLICDNGYWSKTPETCASNAICWDGQEYDLEFGAYYQSEQLSAVICGGECNPGTIVCNGDQTMECGADGQWDEPADCTAGRCEEQAGFAQCEMECIPGQKQCASQGALSESVCGEDGLWGVATDCDVTESCRIDNAGVHVGCVQCLGPSTNGNGMGIVDSRCDSLDSDEDLNTDEIQTCNASNQWESPVACAESFDCVPGNANSNGTVAYCTAAPL